MWVCVHQLLAYMIMCLPVCMLVMYACLSVFMFELNWEVLPCLSLSAGSSGWVEPGWRMQSCLGLLRCLSLVPRLYLGLGFKGVCLRTSQFYSTPKTISKQRYIIFFPWGSHRASLNSIRVTWDSYRTGVCVVTDKYNLKENLSYRSSMATQCLFLGKMCHNIRAS